MRGVGGVWEEYERINNAVVAVLDVGEVDEESVGRVFSK